MNKSLLRSLLFIVLIILSMTSVYAIWWDASWPLKQELTLDVSSGVAPENYSVKLDLNSSNVGAGFDWSNECSLNKSRVRIVDSTQSFTLPFWVEECSSSGENMTLWFKYNENITTSGSTAYLYYGNTGSSLYSKGNETFEFFMNLTGLTQESETSGSSQDQSGDNIITNSGTQVNFYGNTWKVYSGFTPSISISNTGEQILELDMIAQDCGEIISLKFDTDATQEDSSNYKWCGTQGWANTPEQTYSESGTWESVYAILNDFSITATHLHLVGDDDGDGSVNGTYRNVRIRSYVANEPTVVIGPEEATNLTLNSMNPINGLTTGNLTLIFTCGAVTSNTSSLTNISLYGNWSGTWQLNETKSVSGTVNSTSFTKTFADNTASYEWNCEAKDDGSNSDFFDTNFTFTIDRTAPSIIIDNPVGTLTDVTPTLNISVSESSTIWYSLNGQPNITLCTQCNISDNSFVYVEEGVHTIDIYANDSYGNSNSSLGNIFTIDMNNSYRDHFNDNSSIEIYNGSEQQGSGVIYSGAETPTYQGIEIGYFSGNLQFIANQWGGSSNAGEVDITCPGGDANCWFETLNGTNISTLDISNGVAVSDSDSSTVGFIMYSQEDPHTRFTPQPNTQASDNLVGICYTSGQWYYDDNNGCNEPFTPRSSDIIIANLTWGITSVTSLEGTTVGGETSLFSYAINTTQNITSIEDVSWSSTGVVGSNNLTIDISVDGGSTWYNSINGGNITNITQGNSLMYRVNMSSDGITPVILESLNITWSTNQNIVPVVTLNTPTNNSNILTNGTVVFEWSITDNSLPINCSLYINGALNETLSCGGSNQINKTLSSGNFNWTIQAEDSDANVVNSTNYFNHILNREVEVSKKIRYENTNQYRINITVIQTGNVQPLVSVDFVDTLFTAGSFTPILDINSAIIGAEYIGRLYGWNFTSTQLNSVYSVSGTDNYSVEKLFILGN